MLKGFKCSLKTLLFNPQGEDFVDLVKAVHVNKCTLGKNNEIRTILAREQRDSDLNDFHIQLTAIDHR